MISIRDQSAGRPTATGPHETEREFRAWFKFSIFGGDRTWVAGVELATASEPPAPSLGPGGVALRASTPATPEVWPALEPFRNPRCSFLILQIPNSFFDNLAVGYSGPRSAPRAGVHCVRRTTLARAFPDASSVAAGLRLFGWASLRFRRKGPGRQEGVGRRRWQRRPFPRVSPRFLTPLFLGHFPRSAP